jgi:hypothetical protein
MNPNDAPDPQEPQLRQSMSAYADAVEPGDGGWDRITARLGRPSPRSAARRWAIPGLAVAAAALVALFLLVGGGPEGDRDEVVTAAGDVAGSMLAVTSDDRLVELDVDGAERREIVRLGGVDAAGGSNPGSGLEGGRPQLAVSADGETAYVTRNVVYMPGCAGTEIRFSVIVAIDVATGAASVVAGGSSTTTVSATAPAVSDFDALAYVETTLSSSPTGACERQVRLVVHDGSDTRAVDWTDDASVPVSLDWSGQILLVTSRSDAGLTVARVPVGDTAVAVGTLDVVPPSAAGAVGEQGVVIAGSADWDGVSFHDEVWFQPSVDPPAGFEGSLDDFTERLFPLPEAVGPLAVDAVGNESVSDLEVLAEGLRQSSEQLVVAIEDIEAALRSGDLSSDQAATFEERQASLVAKRIEYEDRVLELQIEANTLAADPAGGMPERVLVVADRRGQSSLLIWTGAERPMAEVPHVLAAVWVM